MQFTSTGSIFVGTFVDFPEPDFIRILQDYVLGGSIYCSKDGFCNFNLILEFETIALDEKGYIISISLRSSDIGAAVIKHATKLGEQIAYLPQGQFFVPAFCDLHVHAPQFLYQGTGLDLPLMEWLDNYAFKAEELIDSSTDLAHKVYSRLAARLKENGTGSVLLFGTLRTETK